MVKAPAFQYYPKEFLSDGKTLVMTAEEVGAYWLLTSVCWVEGSLANDIESLAKIARTPKKSFQKMWDAKIKTCFRLRGKKWVHPRLEKEREKQAELSLKRSESGKKGGRPKQETNSLAKGKQKKALHLHSAIASASADINTHPNPPNGRGVKSGGGEIELRENAVSAIGELARSIPADARLDAERFHDAIERGLIALGWSVERESWTEERGDGRRGKIDLFVKSPLPIGIELDRNSPRIKSIEKLNQIDALRVIILREKPTKTYAEGIDAVICATGKVESEAEPNQESPVVHPEPTAGAMEDADREWAIVLKSLRSEIDADAFKTWIEPIQCTAVDRDVGRCWLSFPSIFYRNWICNNYLDQIRTGLKEAPGGWEFYFDVEEE